MLKRLVVLRTSIQHAHITKRSLSLLSTGGRARYETSTALTCHQHHQLLSASPSSPFQILSPKAVLTKTTSFIYKFHPLPASSLDQLRTTLLTDLGALGIVGRIYISTEGLNAQLSCPEQALTSLRDYCTRSMAPLLGGELMDLNFGTQGDTPAFRALHVRIRKQLVADGLASQLQQYRATHGKEPVLIDMRNHYESHIGYFDGAIRPDADTFKDSIDAMNDICKDLPRDQEVFMYCTGGIRCTKAGAILQSQSGFDTVHLVEGGITAYGRWIQDQDHLQSLFRGKNFTFDARMGKTLRMKSLELGVIGATNQARVKAPQRQYYDAAGPVMVDGVRAYVKEGHALEESKRHDRVVVGTSGKACEHEYHRRTRAIDVLGEPGQVLKEWANAGRQLPAADQSSTQPSNSSSSSS
ncbi:unnamed protein product [Absidia cylindrospora]